MEMPARNGRAAALFAVFILLGTTMIVLPTVAEADVIPNVIVSAQQLNISLNEGDSTKVKVDIINLSGPAVQIGSLSTTLSLISGDEDDIASVVISDFQQTCLFKTIAKGESCTFTQPIETDKLALNEDDGLAVTQVTLSSSFKVPPDTTILQALDGGFDVTVFDPGSPSAVPEPSTPAPLAAFLAALAAWKKRSLSAKWL